MAPLGPFAAVGAGRASGVRAAPWQHAYVTRRERDARLARTPCAVGVVLVATARTTVRSTRRAERKSPCRELFSDRHIKTPFALGLLDEHVERAVAMLLEE